MKIVFFCENKNSIRLSNKIIENERLLNNENIDIKFITCDWTGTITQWIKDEKANLQYNIINIMDMFEDEKDKLCNNIDKITKNCVIKDIFIKYFTNEQPNLVIMYNDSSFRGKQCSLATKKLNIIRFLIQDGHLNFESKNNILDKTDQNFYYGQTKPERIFVWGEALKNKIIYDHKNNPNSIIISGCLTNIHYDDINDDLIHIKNNSKLHILIADQPLCDQNKMERSAWRVEFKTLIDALSTYNLTIKIHPSTIKNTIDEIVKMLPKSCTVNTSSFITSDYLRQFDLVITYFSSIYLDCLASKTPVIFYNFTSCDILFPEIKNKLFYNVYSITGLIDILNEINIKRIFKYNKNGMEIDYYIARKYNTSDIIVDNIFDIYNNKFTIYHDDFMYKKPMYTQLSIENNYIIEENPKSICIIGDDFNTTTGVAYPILNYFNYMKLYSDSKFQFILVKKDMPIEYIVERAKKYSYIIINSLAFFFRYKNAVNVIEKLQNKFVYIYAHETDYVIQYEKKYHSNNYNKFAKIAPNLFFLCVSRTQKELFHSYGWKKSTVIYNCINIEHIINNNTSEYKTVLMSGTIQDRKGVGLFCKVADILSPKGYKFIWCGAWTPKCTSMLSNNVEWVGFKSRTELLKLLNKADIFFLSSFDDPFPLSLLEASALNKKIVSYNVVGSYEAIYHTVGYESFFRYNPLAAADAIERVNLIQQSDINTKTIYKYFTPLYFSARMNIALKVYRYESRISFTNKIVKTNITEQKEIVKIFKKIFALKNIKLFFKNFIKKNFKK